MVRQKGGITIEKVIIVGVETPHNWKTFQESLEELKSLAVSAHGEIVGELTQKQTEVNRKYVIGKGKVEELKQQIELLEADLVIFNHELTPRQSQLLIEALDRPVIDRVQLILDIFAARAKSKEGKLQVELAQLNYLLPRLVGQGKSLSRLGGGIGTRGPGETKLETDRRHIQYRITKIKRNLKEIEKQREQNRKNRKSNNVFQIGLVGYTNAGKSTILNTLTNAETFEKDQLFATLDPLTRKWRLPQGMNLTLTDTVGFMQDLPTQLIEAFHSTLEESRVVDLLLHVVDASSDYRDIQEKTVMQLLNELEMASIPRVTVYTKSDLLEGNTFTPTLFPNFLVSLKKDDAKEKVTENIVKELEAVLQPYQIMIPTSETEKLQQLRNETLVLSEDYQEESEIYEIKGFCKETSRWYTKGEKLD